MRGFLSQSLVSSVSGKTGNRTNVSLGCTCEIASDIRGNEF